MSPLRLILCLALATLVTPDPATAQTQAVTTPPIAAPKPAAPAKPATQKPVPVVQPPKAAKVARQARHPAPAAALPATTAAPAAAAAPAPVAPAEPAKGTVTGLPLPRFAALRSDDVNLRAGPGTRYQIEWVYHRRELPVEIQREFEVWRLVSDMDGVKGWVHQATLVGRRTFIVKGADDQPLRRSAADTAAPAAILKSGVVGRILSCVAGADWCEVQAGDYRGWLKRSAFWGSNPGELIER